MRFPRQTFRNSHSQIQYKVFNIVTVLSDKQKKHEAIEGVPLGGGWLVGRKRRKVVNEQNSSRELWKEDERNLEIRKARKTDSYLANLRLFRRKGNMHVFDVESTDDCGGEVYF